MKINFEEKNFFKNHVKFVKEGSISGEPFRCIINNKHSLFLMASGFITTGIETQIILQISALYKYTGRFCIKLNLPASI